MTLMLVPALLAAIAISSADRQFIYTALQMNSDDVTISQAYADSADHNVRAFAQVLHTDSSESNEQLIPIANSHGIHVSRAQGPGVPFEATPLPSKLQPKGAERQMQQMPPTQFFQREISVDKKAIALYEHEEATTQDGQLKGYVARTLPFLKRHLAEATKGVQDERRR